MMAALPTPSSALEWGADTDASRRAHLVDDDRVARAAPVPDVGQHHVDGLGDDGRIEFLELGDTHVGGERRSQVIADPGHRRLPPDRIFQIFQIESLKALASLDRSRR
jgi:hypothetical protein